MTATRATRLLLAASLSLVAYLLASMPARALADAQDAGAVASPTCTESIPTGATRPTLVEKVTAREKAGSLIDLEIAVRHGAGESATLPADLPIVVGNGEVRIADDGSWGRSALPPTVVDPTDPTHATTLLHVPFVILSTALQRTKFTLPSLRVIVLRKGGGDLTVCTAPHEVQIDQPIASTPDPFPRPNPSTVPQITRDERAQAIATWSAIALATGAILTALFIWWRRRPKELPPPPPPPAAWKVALEEIEAARVDYASGAVATKQYYDRLSDAVRKYLGKMYGFDGLDMTTDEMMARVRRLLTPVPHQDIASFLGSCDLVKFAGVSPGSEDDQTTADLGKYIVRATSTAGAMRLRPFDATSQKPSAAPPSARDARDETTTTTPKAEAPKRDEAPKMQGDSRSRARPGAWDDPDEKQQEAPSDDVTRARDDDDRGRP